jgi:hypothetical protein
VFVAMMRAREESGTPQSCAQSTGNRYLAQGMGDRSDTKHFRVDGDVLDVWESVGCGGTVGIVRDDGASQQLRDLALWATQWADYLDLLGVSSIPGGIRKFRATLPRPPRQSFFNANTVFSNGR